MRSRHAQAEREHRCQPYDAVVTQPRSRIAVIGRSGAGKTTVALLLAEALELPVVHLDRLYWGPDWAAMPAEVFNARQADAASGEGWVIDGSYLASPGWKARLQRADVIVLVEASMLTCLWRVVRRSLASTRSRRPDLPDGCEEQLSLYHLWWTLGWSVRHRGMTEVLRSANPDARLISLRSTDDVPSLVRLVTEGR